jgi:hypothetical protein
MTGGFAADADRIGARSHDFADHAQRARTVARSLQTALESAEQAWGSDAVGQSFAAAHAKPAGRALELLGGLGGELEAIGGKFSAAAGTYRAVDDAAVDDTRAPGRELGEA